MKNDYLEVEILIGVLEFKIGFTRSQTKHRSTPNNPNLARSIRYKHMN